MIFSAFLCTPFQTRHLVELWELKKRKYVRRDSECEALLEQLWRAVFDESTPFQCVSPEWLRVGFQVYLYAFFRDPFIPDDVFFSWFYFELVLYSMSFFSVSLCLVNIDAVFFFVNIVSLPGRH